LLDSLSALNLAHQFRLGSHIGNATHFAPLAEIWGGGLVLLVLSDDK
jgi:hypothetical protein